MFDKIITLVKKKAYYSQETETGKTTRVKKLFSTLRFFGLIT